MEGDILVVTVSVVVAFVIFAGSLAYVSWSTHR